MTHTQLYQHSSSRSNKKSACFSILFALDIRLDTAPSRARIERKVTELPFARAIRRRDPPTPLALYIATT